MSSMCYTITLAMHQHLWQKKTVINVLFFYNLGKWFVRVQSATNLWLFWPLQICRHFDCYKPPIEFFFYQFMAVINYHKKVQIDKKKKKKKKFVCGARLKQL